MSGSLSVIDESRFEWKTLKSKNGASFKVGRPKSDGGVTGGNIKAAAAAVGILRPAKNNFGISVNWPVEYNAWKSPTDDQTKVSAITGYCLETTGTLLEPYKYILHFINTEHYDYKFTDESNDVYEVDTWSNGNHYVQYNSDQPTIIYVSGS